MKQLKKRFNVKDSKNNFKLNEVIIITLSFSVIFSFLTGYFIYRKYNGNSTNTNDIIKTYNKILDTYYEEVDKNALADSAIDGMMNYLNEKYSEYLDKDSALSLNDKLDGSYKGIGIQIGKRNNIIQIINVFIDTPAEKAGLQAGDVIKVIDGEDVSKYQLSKLVELIQDKDTTTMLVERNGKELEFKINIKEIDNPVVTYSIFNRNDKKIGYIYLSSFSKSSYDQIKKSLNNLEKQEIDSLIFDVRGNTGGYLNSVTDILELFIKKGKVLYSLEEKSNKTIIYDESNEKRTYPIVVLIDNASASASEILASSLKESYGAILVGVNTYGKGKVQQTSTLNDDSMVKYTTAKWYTPNGNSIDEIGIKPGVYVELTEKYANNPSDETDDQLQKAIDVVSKMN